MKTCSYLARIAGATGMLHSLQTALPVEVNVHQGNKRLEPRACGRVWHGIGCSNHRWDIGDGDGGGRPSDGGIILLGTRTVNTYPRCLVLGAYVE